jgi:N-acetylglucosamine kinase-like BadF-type ATPase
MSYYLGIDGGGTKTKCLLGDEHDIIASETAAGSNVIRLGETVARTALHQGILSVCTKGGIRPEQIVAACAGVGGAAHEAGREQVRRIIAELVPGHIEVIGDMAIAHEAALAGEAGIVVIAGTGSIAYGRNEAGKTSRSGGWGYIISDEGSGHWIGVQAVAMVAQFSGRGQRTRLEDRILQRWNLNSVDEIVQRANTFPLPDFAGLFPDVLDLEGSEPVVGKILERAGVQLADLAEPVHRSLWKPPDSVNVALAGGVFQNSGTVRESFQFRMKELGLRARVELSTSDPARGALARARKLAAGHFQKTTSR